MLLSDLIKDHVFQQLNSNFREFAFKMAQKCNHLTSMRKVKYSNVFLSHLHPNWHNYAINIRQYIWEGFTIKWQINDHVKIYIICYFNMEPRMFIILNRSQNIMYKRKFVLIYDYDFMSTMSGTAILFHFIFKYFNIPDFILLITKYFQRINENIFCSFR